MKGGFFMFANITSELIDTQVENPESRLKALSSDLSVDLLKDVIANAYSTSINIYNGFESPSGKGITFFNIEIDILRDALQSKGWTVDNTHNVATIISPERSIRIGCTAGDSQTGKTGIGPKIRHKGRATLEVSGQMVIPNFERSTNSTESKLWYLVKYVDEGSHEIRSELSLPFLNTASSKFIGWKDRIILPPYSTKPIPITMPQDVPAPTIPVRRKVIGE